MSLSHQRRCELGSSEPLFTTVGSSNSPTLAEPEGRRMTTFGELSIAWPLRPYYEYTEGFRHCCRRPSKRRPTEDSSSKSFHLHSNTK